MKQFNNKIRSQNFIKLFRWKFWVPRELGYSSGHFGARLIY